MLKIVKRFAWFGLLAVMALAVYVGIVRAGPLDPPGPVGSTMKTLDEIPGSWHRKLSATGSDPCNTARFRCVLDNEAVLDLETGLVWERDAGGPPDNWYFAHHYHCRGLDLGGRMGWRLPTLEELLTLIDPSVAYPAVSLPDGHPFANVSSADRYWTASQDPANPLLAVTVGFVSGSLIARDNIQDIEQFWCVRGHGGGYDWGYDI
jgi:hypothetical protein